MSQANAPTQTSVHLTILTGASRGMGLAMARQLLDQGHHLLCLSRNENAELTAHAQACNGTLIQWCVDLADPARVRERLQNWLASQSTGHIASATLINNAGVIPTVGPLGQCPADELSNALRVGVEAPMQLTAGFLAATQVWVNAAWSGARKVLNISSGLGRRPMAAQAPYCAAKAGMDLFTRCCALEEAAKPNGAKLVSLAPGVIDTDMQIQLRGSDAAGFPDRQRFVDLKAHDQLTSPADAARAVLGWLDRADFGEEPIADVRDA
ncbi:SDR family NAD(P)-dependent oxidoreductase [Hydrogenophaga sp. 5NK40-0174]|uniref:SDR family NAD(P)-dependent oxidoreductase n=1 Tax=Hydrogenophaga sp. 5NK40-0174 TaxID=3127649 RepID=UPI003103718E